MPNHGIRESNIAFLNLHENGSAFTSLKRE